MILVDQIKYFTISDITSVHFVHKMHLNKKVENLVAHSRTASLHLDAQQNFRIYAIYAGLKYILGTKKMSA